MSRVAHLLPQRCSITRAVKTLVDGQVNESRSTVATSVPCRVSSPSRGSLTVYAGAEDSKRPRRIYFEAGYDVRANDEVVVAGTTYRAIDAEDQPDGAYRLVSAEDLA